MKETLTIVIPAFNEEKNLPVVLPGLISYCRLNGFNIIIVNDGSTDHSREVLQHFESEELLKVIHHKLNRGYGAAIKSGIRHCNTEFVITIDADGQHLLEDIGSLHGFIREKDADMVVGSRKGLKSSSYFRGVGKSIIRLIAKILMPVPIHDINSGMKIYRTDLAMKYIHLAPDTMSFSDIITLIFINNRHLVLEHPISINPRIHGKSTISVETAFQTVMEIINIVILFNPMKIILPIAVISTLSGILWGLPMILMGHGVSTGSLLGIISGFIFFLLGLIAEQLSQIRRNQR